MAPQPKALADTEDAAKDAASPSCNVDPHKTKALDTSLKPQKGKKESLSDMVNRDMTFKEQVSLTLSLSMPAIMAQFSTIAMQYIDAAMVGSLGANASASVGLMAAPLWLFSGICITSVSGYSVQIAHLLGGRDHVKARIVMRQAYVVLLIFSVIVGLIAAGLSPFLPAFMGGAEEIRADATHFFAVLMIGMPFMMLNFISSAMLRCSGNMMLPSLLNIMMCLLDIFFNSFLIFDGHHIPLPWLDEPLFIKGAGLGVPGAAVGTIMAAACTSIVMTYACTVRSKTLALNLDSKEGIKHYAALHVASGTVTSQRLHDSANLEHGEAHTEHAENEAKLLGDDFKAETFTPLGFFGQVKLFKPTIDVVRRALRISLPITAQQIMIASAQIVSTMIVAPLGTVAIAAHSLAITIEAICYMPGFGISDAATTLVGQSIGARRFDLTYRFAKITMTFGCIVMGLMGALMYFCSPIILGIMTPDLGVQELGVTVLRIQAFAEPFFALAIVGYGICVGAGDSLIPSVMNLASMWVLRLSLAFFLAQQYGLEGVWIAMACELTFRGLIFLGRLKWANWIKELN